MAHVTEPPKLGPPLHIHHEDDESFYILKGQVTFYIGDEIIEASTGDYVFAPKGIPHRLVSGPEQAEFLVTSTPAKFDAFVKELGTPVSKDADLPEVKTPSPEELQHLVKVAKAFNMTILG
ncbi:cupin domain-containing protein [Bacillus sp. SRB_331]|uniref:cupin domain-containing protein n=1 Tax=Bacillus sp. SRB_331 TaxID=1969379 RepID=UPI0021ABFC5C|nr:cupin domain-containing protein [Bacillus sp. SRB_331]